MFCGKWNSLKTSAFCLSKRHKSVKTHLLERKKQKSVTDRALDHFDDFYGSVFGEAWKPMRKALMQKQKYVALINNFGDEKSTMEFMERLGAHDMKRLFEIQKEFIASKNEFQIKNNVASEDQTIDKDARMKSFSEKVNRSEIEEIYKSAGNVEIPKTIDTGGAVIGKKDTKIVSKTEGMMEASLAASMTSAEIDTSRIIYPNTGMSSASLWTFQPATRLKGCEDWIPESDHYKYYSSADDFPLTIEEEDSLDFPEHLHVYSFENNNMSTFPEPKRGLTGVYNYYVMDGASILPVLALGLKNGDRVLDMCSAPGGKALTALQTMLPDVLVANDSSSTRVKRIINVFRQYLYDFETSNKWSEKVIISNVCGQIYNDENGFDKVLVDVPCTTDRHSLKSDDNNIFKAARIKERLKIPELQSNLLSSALSLCRIGGTVVYSTCSLSPIQNDGVVHMGLKKAWETYRVKATIKLLTKAMEPVRILFRIGDGATAPRYGQLITPYHTANFGPSYFAKIVRTA